MALRSVCSALLPRDSPVPTRPHRSACVLLLILAAALLGCVGDFIEAGNKAKRRKENFDDLKAYAQAYMNVSQRFQRAPKSWDELQEAGLDPGVRDRLSADGYTVVMGVYITQMMVGSNNFMLAFPRAAEQEGGQVGFADGHVREITADEFREKMSAQTANMETAILFEPASPPTESGVAGVISAPASGSSPAP